MEKLKNSGFLSMDALFALLIVLLLMGPLVNLYSEREETSEDTQVLLESRMICEQLAGSVNVLVATGEPLSLRLDLQDNIGDSSYSLAFDEEMRKIYVDGSSLPEVGFSSGSVSAQVAAKRVDNLGNIDPRGRIEIYWNEDTITVKNI
ncbi:MAG: hypothetical protein ACLFUR_01710 [Candidatus Hadarchaeia archaeon]